MTTTIQKLRLKLKAEREPLGYAAGKRWAVWKK